MWKNQQIDQKKCRSFITEVLDLQDSFSSQLTSLLKEEQFSYAYLRLCGWMKEIKRLWISHKDTMSLFSGSNSISWFYKPTCLMNDTVLAIILYIQKNMHNYFLNICLIQSLSRFLNRLALALLWQHSLQDLSNFPTVSLHSVFWKPVLSQKLPQKHISFYCLILKISSFWRLLHGYEELHWQPQKHCACASTM